MSEQRQLIELKKTALEKFQTALKENSSSFLPKLTEYYFSYLMATWGLAAEDRSVFSSVFISKIYDDIKAFCDKHHICFNNLHIHSLFPFLMNEEHIINRDISVRRLFLHYLGYHKNFLARFFYDFPAEEHEKIVNTYLTGFEKSKNPIHETQKKRILADSKKVQKEFMNDITIYGEKYHSERLYVYTAAATLALLLYPYYRKSAFNLIFFISLGKDNAIIVSNFVIGLLLFGFITYLKHYYVEKLVLYKESIRWKNFSGIHKLPDEFKNFLFEQAEEIKKILITFEEEAPKTSKHRSFNNSRDVFSGVTDEVPFLLETTHTKKVPKPTKPKNIVTTSATTSSQESPKKEPQIKEDIKWYYADRHVSYNPALRRCVIKLWNNTMNHLNDYIDWDFEKIKKAINDFNKYKAFAIKAGDGHRIKREEDQQGFLKRGSTAYHLKLLGFFGDPRVKFVHVDESKDSDNRVAHLYAFKKYIPTHTKRT